MIKQNKNSYRIGKTYEELYGKEFADAYKNKISIALKGKKYSEEQKKKYEKSHNEMKGKTFEERYGKERAIVIRRKISEATKKALSNPEVRAKISARQTGRKMPRSVVEKRARTMKERGYKHSEQTKRKIGDANAISLKGKKQPFEMIEKRRLKLIGHNVSLETRNKIRMANTGKCPSEETRNKMRKPKSEEHKKNMSLVRIGKHHTEETKMKMSTIWNSPKYLKIAKERRAKQIFPIKDTTIEIILQNYLKQLGIEFYTHHYVSDIEHKYQCDIFLPSKKLIIEADGAYWHNYPLGTEIDIIRNNELREKGYKVLRFWENEIRVMEIGDLKNKLIQMEIIK